MKLPSPTEKKLLDEIAVTWRSGSVIRARYSEKHGKDLCHGTFYTLLRRLTEGGWVTMRKGADTDQRHRYYRITAQAQKLKGKLDALHKAMEPFENRKELKA